MTYFLLCTRDDNVWLPQFGDTDKECVEFERDEMVYAFKMGLFGNARKDTKIVSFKRIPTQSQVNTKIAELNQ